MTLRGRVQNGVVVLDNGSQLPEGQEVLVHTAEPQVEKRHSILDIPAVSVGEILKPFSPDDDILGEMLEGRHL